MKINLHLAQLIGNAAPPNPDKAAKPSDTKKSDKVQELIDNVKQSPVRNGRHSFDPAGYSTHEIEAALKKLLNEGYKQGPQTIGERGQRIISVYPPRKKP